MGWSLSHRAFLYAIQLYEIPTCGKKKKSSSLEGVNLRVMRIKREGEEGQHFNSEGEKLSPSGPDVSRVMKGGSQHFRGGGGRGSQSGRSGGKELSVDV